MADGLKLVYKFCHSRGFSSGILFDDVDDGAANDRALGEFADRCELLRRRDSETDGNGKVGEAADALDESLGVAGHLLARAGEPTAGVRVNKPGGNLWHSLQTL